MIVQIEDYFKGEKARIELDEQNWVEKEQICEELLKLSSHQDTDRDILIKSHFIGIGLDKLNEKVKFKELKLVNSLDTVLHHRDDLDNPIEISAITLKHLFKGYLAVNEYNKLQYKC